MTMKKNITLVLVLYIVILGTIINNIFSEMSLTAYFFYAILAIGSATMLAVYLEKKK
ncbi:hypothetical protein AB3K25_00830 [Leuconostoc sp. MS02]|uniref:Uncharacterized protein n=1 Tax=Leuconostoc aquikimchii TaxID=3236804 RepID=A0ABV3S5A5_9LACO